MIDRLFVKTISSLGLIYSLCATGYNIGRAHSYEEQARIEKVPVRRMVLERKIGEYGNLAMIAITFGAICAFGASERTK